MDKMFKELAVSINIYIGTETEDGNLEDLK